MSRDRSCAAGIEIVGADENNLKQVNVTFPLGQITVVRGVSGSGKSSLLADTLAAEGSRRMRLFLGQSQRELERDGVRAFLGPMPPTLLVGQRGFRPSIRTTVGTATGLLATLRRLFVIAARPWSERAGREVPAPSALGYARWIAAYHRGVAEVWAAPVRDQETDGRAVVDLLASHGIDEVTIWSETDSPRQDTGRVVKISEFLPLNPEVAHTIEARVGSVDVKGPAATEPLGELLERAFACGDGAALVMLPDLACEALAGPYGTRLDSRLHWVHPDDRRVFAPPTPHLLSFNAPGHELSGACPVCGGTGVGRRLDEAALVSRPDRSLRDGAFALWTERNYKYLHIQHETIEGLRDIAGFAPDVPWKDLPATARALVLDGCDEPVVDRDLKGRKIGQARPFLGFRRVILDKAARTGRTADRLAPYVEEGACTACEGSRWAFQARALRVGGEGVVRILALTFDELAALTDPEGDFARALPSSAQPLVQAIHQHACSLITVGLGYLTGDRGMLEVSEGESRRVRLARVLDAGERGLCLLLDEPARGLHESDLARLASALERLRGRHTLILNEHRERLWRVADQLVELGPGAGAGGGELVYAGPRKGHRVDRPPGDRRSAQPVDPEHPMLRIRGAAIHNVRDLDCDIPLGRLNVISGVSRSGKSSFLRGVLAPALYEALGETPSDFALRHGTWRSVQWGGAIDRIVALDQTMPPPNRRSLVATFTGVFDDLRKAFAAAPAAREKGLKATDFGVNAGQGRCAVCRGIGEISDDGDHWSVCPGCGGSRYGQTVLSVRIDGDNVQDLLETRVEELGDRSDSLGIPSLLIDTLRDLGLGYLAFGRRMDTLSGGEVQRLRLALRLAAPAAGPTLFLLDEPAVGLHPRDVARVEVGLDRALDQGRNTVVIVEHDLQLIRAADWVLEFGPGSGPDGGRIVFAGPPSRLATSDSPTGRALAGELPEPEPVEAEGRGAGVEGELSPREHSLRTASLLRTLISGEPTPIGISEGEPDALAEPVALVSADDWTEHDPWEVAGLDLEVPKLLLDLQGANAGADRDLEALLAAWDSAPHAWLAIHPLLAELRIWGTRLPGSIWRARCERLATEGLDLVTPGGEPINSGEADDVRSVRATGDRFRPETDSRDARSRALRDSFVLGARYVELRDEGGGLLAMAAGRLLDLDTGLVAPLAPVPSHFSRHEERGRCPQCRGRRGVEIFEESLVLGKTDVPPDAEEFLAPPAAAITKGVRRNWLKPFLRRLAEEGLWEPDTPYADLDSAGREMILFGDWSRPGSGSFLKSSRADPDKVSSWLRWDGLYRHLAGQLDRSRDDAWVEQLRETARVVACPLCDGTGLQAFARLLRVGESSFPAWTTLGDARRRLDLLRAVEVRSHRQERTLERLLDCFEPLAGAISSLSVVERAVRTFTTMPSFVES